MNETELEVPERQQEGYESGLPRKAEAGRPSEKQKSYLAQLAGRAGVKIDVSKVQSSAAASRLIGQLRLLDTRMNGQNGKPDNEARDQRIAFGLATKLVYGKYLERHKEVRRSKKFWDEVAQLYQDYRREQERALASADTHFVEASVLRGAPQSF